MSRKLLRRGCTVLWRYKTQLALLKWWLQTLISINVSMSRLRSSQPQT